MTSTEAFNEAMKIIKNSKMRNWYEQKPIEAFLTPAKVIWLWIRINDYFVINEKYPTSYKKLHAWEEIYYTNN